MGACQSIVPSGYSTSKEVVLLDRKLGILYTSCILIVLAYVLGVRVALNHEFNLRESSNGIVGFQLNGTTYSVGPGGKPHPADIATLVMVDEASGSIFLPMKWLVSRDQRVDHCGDPNEPCDDNADSTCIPSEVVAAGICDSHLCTKLQWCNPGTCIGVLADPFEGPEAPADGDFEYLDQGCKGTAAPNNEPCDPPGPLEGGARSGTQDRISLYVEASIEFPHLSSGLMTTEDGRNSRVRWTLKQVLDRSGLSVKDAFEKGGALSVIIDWECDPDNSELEAGACVPVLKAEQLNPGQPFTKSWAYYYQRALTADDATCDPSSSAGTDLSDGVVEFRTLTQARGLWLVASTRGTAQKADLLQIVLQVFVALALMPLAAGLADFIMTQLFSERRHYREYKTDESPDFSDVRAKVEQLEKQSQSRAAKAMDYA